MKTIELFQQEPEVLEFYHNKFRYIHVDEYQDTNHAQYMLCRMLADKHQQHLRRRRQRPVDLPLARRGYHEHPEF